MSEFADECRVLYHNINDLGLTGKTLDAPLLCAEPFFTDYGLHYIAALSSDEATDKPTKDEVRLYRAYTLLDESKKAVETAKSNIESYAKNGYNTSSYEAQKALAEEKVTKYQAAYDALLAELGLDKDYTLDTEANTRITKWYSDAETKVESGTLVTREYIRLMKESLNKLGFDANSKYTATSFNAFLDLLIAACDDADNE